MTEQRDEISGPLSALIAEHAPHGFDGVMRGANQGCSIYVAAVALDDALRLRPGKEGE